jgi:hypothetical protein
VAGLEAFNLVGDPKDSQLVRAGPGDAFVAVQLQPQYIIERVLRAVTDVVRCQALDRLERRTEARVT